MGEQLLKRKSAYHFKLDSFLQLFIHQFSTSTPPTIYFLCPYTNQLISLMDIYSIGNGVGMAIIEIHKLQNISFTQLFSFKKFKEKDFWALWQKEKKRFRLKPIRLYGSESKWHKWLYERGYHRDHLPSIVHLPVRAQYLMKQPPWQWQSKLVIEVLEPLPIGGSFSLDRLTSILRHKVYPDTVFPLIKASSNPIEEYLQLLCKFGWLQEINPRLYRKVTQISFHSSLEDSMNEDRSLVLQI